MIPNTIKFTKEGFEKIQKEFQRLTEERKEILIRLRTAREMGDLSENGAYKAARFELSSTDRELRRLTYLLRFGVVVESTHSDTIAFGSQITVTDGKKPLTFTLVDVYESNPQEKKLSTASPIGKAVFGKKVGQVVEVKTPAGQVNYTITQVS